MNLNREDLYCRDWNSSRLLLKIKSTLQEHKIAVLSELQIRFCLFGMLSIAGADLDIAKQMKVTFEGQLALFAIMIHIV